MKPPHSDARTLVDVLEARADSDPSLPAFTFLADGDEEQGQLTVAELAQKARSIGAWLAEEGFSGARILLLFEQGLPFVAAYFGCAYAGAIAIPAPMPHASRLARTLPRLHSMLADARPAAVLTSREGLALATEVTAFITPIERRPRLLAFEDCPWELGSSWRAPALSPEAPAHLQYTSGSTASPKGTVITHTNVLENSKAIRARKRYSSSSRSVVWVPHFHDDGLIHGLIQPIFTGYPCALMPAGAMVARPERWLRAIGRARATHAGGPNFAYELCLRKVTDEQRAALDLSSWVFAYSAAEPVRAETLRRFDERFAPCGFRWKSFAPCYGLAEATLTVSVGLRDEGPRLRTLDGAALDSVGAVREVAESAPGARTFVGCGPPVEGTEVVLVDPTTGERCAPDQIGEIFVASPSIAAGYLERPEESEQTFGARIKGTSGATYLRTGDQGFVMDGELFITGRIKDLIIIRGENRYPQDIEWTVGRCHSAIAPGSIAAFAVDVAGEERLVIAAEVRPGSAGATPAEGGTWSRPVFAAIREAISRDHDVRPWAIALLPAAALPKTSSGKIQRRACRSAFLEGTLEELDRWTAATNAAAPEPKAKPRTSAKSIEAWLLEYLTAELQVAARDVEVDAPFSQMGLDSAGAVGLAADLGAWLGLRLPPTIAWDYPSILAMSRRFGGDPAPERAPSPRGAEAVAEPIAIIGAACRFPGGVRDLPSFWRLLERGVDAIEEVPKERWSIDAYYDPDPGAPGKMVTRWGGFLPGVDQFEPGFFEITPREAAAMDPQQRLLLEVSWEALELSGQTPEQLRGSNTGVFMGISSHEYQAIAKADGALNPYLLLGTSHSTGVARLSYWLGLVGPNMPVDTACSSSLSAVHLACQALRNGECSMALAGGVNLLLSPDTTVGLSQMRALSPTGRCRAFSADADGYVRSEGCGVAVLKRLSDAERDGDPILAVIRGSAMNQDGRSNGPTAPHGPSQEAVIRRALEQAGVEARSVGYVEAHGTGTPLGDPIEVGALAAVLGEGRAAAEPCVIGSVKTNIGHTEAAAGIAGLFKAVLAVSRGTIPKSLHFAAPSMHIPWSSLPLRVAAEATPWSTPGARRIAGVSSFGISGTNAHVILEEAPRTPARAPHRSASSGYLSFSYLLPLSAKGPPALAALAGDVASFLARTDAELGDIAYTAGGRRSHREERLAVVGSSKAEIAAALSAYGRGEMPSGLAIGRATRAAPKIALVFTGQGSQWAGMGQALFREEPVFRRSLEACDQALRPHTGFSVIEEMGRPEVGSRLHETAVAQPALFALEVALASLLRSWGVVPDAVIGHSVGEAAAAHVSGILDLAQAAELVAVRGRVMQKAAGRGKMVAVALGEEEAHQEIAKFTDRIGIAAVNGPAQVVLSGDAATLEALVEELQSRAIECRALRVDYAFHSPQMEPLVNELVGAVGHITPKRAAIPMISTVTGEVVQGEELGAAYWGSNIRRTVRFAQGSATARALGYDLFVEAGPHPILTPTLRRALSTGGEEGRAVSTLRYGREERRCMLEALAALYTHGARINWSTLYPEGGRVVPLPTYRWQRERCWFESKEIKEMSTRTPQGAIHPASMQVNNRRQPPASNGEAKAAHEPDVLNVLRDEIAAISGLRGADIPVDTPVVELGLDSLMLLHLVSRIKNRFGAEYSLAAFFRDAVSTRRLAQDIAEKYPPTPSVEAPALELSGVADDAEARLITATAPHGDSGLAVLANLTALFSQQVGALDRAIATLQGASGAPLKPAPPVKPVNSDGVAARIGQAGPPNAGAAARAVPVAPPVAPKPAQYSIVHLAPDERSTETQERFVTALIERRVARTAKSKAYAEQHRGRLADWINVLSFRKTMKELSYPIVAARSEGSRFWDIDGNEFLDIAAGYGSGFFGHRPPFVVRALEEQLSRGFELGPQSALAGEVADLICELTKMERVTFCNTGSEAVMVSLRLARAITGRRTIVRFRDSFHGTFDGVLADADRSGVTRPMAIGTPDGMIEDVLVFEYGAPEALDVIRERGHEIAAVLVEPVQSRRPDLQPRELLRELRRITSECGAALIFDEVITGFRIHPGGAQAHFGVDADIAIYGKLVGGGMPIGVIACRGRFLDALDGGPWRFGDDSYPAHPTTIFGGTFCKHPLAMAAVRAVLLHLKEQGPALQEAMNRRTDRLAAECNAHFDRRGVPFHVSHFASQFRFESHARYSALIDLFFHLLMDRGVYTWERRVCYLTTAHTDEDVDLILTAIKGSIDDMVNAGFFARSSDGATPGDGRATQPTEPRVMPMPSLHRRAFTKIEAIGPDRAPHIFDGWQIDGLVDVGRLERAFQSVVARHDSLRTGFERRGDELVVVVHPHVTASPAVIDVSEDALDAALKACIAPFDLARPPLARLSLLRTPQRSVLLFDIHHILVDGHAVDVFVRELMAAYEGAPLPPVAQYGDYVAWLDRRSREIEAMGAYWLERFGGELPALKLPADFARPNVRNHEGRAIIRRVTVAGLSELARKRRASTFMVVLAAYYAWLHLETGQDDLIVGAIRARRDAELHGNLIWMTLNTIALRVRLGSEMTFGELLSAVQTTCVDAYANGDYPFERLVERLGAARDPSRHPVFDALIAYERAEGRVVEINGMRAARFNVEKRACECDIDFEVTEQDGVLEMTLTFATALFREETMDRLARSCVQVLEEAVAHPDRRLRDLGRPGRSAGNERLDFDRGQ